MPKDSRMDEIQGSLAKIHHQHLFYRIGNPFGGICRSLQGFRYVLVLDQLNRIALVREDISDILGKSIVSSMFKFGYSLDRSYVASFS